MSMKQLWAPWRMEFLTDAKDQKLGCVFCTLPQEDDDRKNLILNRGEKVFVIMNKYPYNNGHVMVVPKLHVARMDQLPDEDLAEMALTVKRAVKAIESAYKPEGFNLGMNLGASAGAGIKDHLHMHVVPRWIGDTNFMPVLSDTKSMPQHLATSYDQLYEHFRRL